MAKYKQTEAEKGQGLFISVNLKEQLIPGSFEYMLDKLIGSKINISDFDENYRNDKTGAKAIPPKVLIKLIIYGYSKGIKSSRGLESLSNNNLIGKALSDDMEPHWTTIANFISDNSEKFQGIFVKVLTYCVELGLVGGNTFAIDGLRLPSNASKELSGTKEELEKRLVMYQRMAEKHVAKHQRKDKLGEVDEKTEKHYKSRQKKLAREIEKISDFLKTMEPKENSRGKEALSNVTDNESALIRNKATYTQGYVGIAVVDKENQVIVQAEAFGSSNEGKHMPEILEKTLDNLEKVGMEKHEENPITILADSNYYSEENIEACHEYKVEALMPDINYRKRLGDAGKMKYEVDDFKYFEDGNYYECPNGKTLEYKGETSIHQGHLGKLYKASVKDCRVCPLFSRCMKSKKEQGKITAGKTLVISKSNEPGSLCRKLIEKMKTEECQDQYSYRIGIVEPVFANISHCKNLNRFGLRGKKKVNGQWQLFCIVHNLGKCLKGFNKEKVYA